jgi:hypothetical protein
LSSDASVPWKKLRLAVKAFKAQEADAFFYTNDAMVSSQAQLIIDTAREKKLRRCSQSRVVLGKEPLPAMA